MGFSFIKFRINVDLLFHNGFDSFLGRASQPCRRNYSFNLLNYQTYSFHYKTF